MKEQHDHSNCSCQCHCHHHEHQQHHEHGISCGCGHEHHHSDGKKELLEIVVGMTIFLIGVIVEKALLSFDFTWLIFVVSYLILGKEIVFNAGKNIIKGQIFDENFLMSVATIAAFVIGDYPEAVGIMLFYRIGEYFEHSAVEKSRKQIMEVLDMRPEVVTKVEGEEVYEIPAAKAQKGDVLLVRPGDCIPLDGVVIKGESQIDTSPMTGEPLPVVVEKGSRVLSGCVNKQGLLFIKVEKILQESMVTRILESVEHAVENKPKVDRFITRFAKIYTPFVVIAAAITAIVPSLFSGDWNYWIYTAITFLVISCPCALVLSVPLAYFSGIGVASRQGILFKGGLSIEVLQKVKAVVLDKTGTVTKGAFGIDEMIPNEAVTEKELLEMAAMCEMHSTHPIGMSIVEEAKKQGIDIYHPQEVREIPGKGIVAVAGKNQILCGNYKLLEEYGVMISLRKEVLYGTEVLVAQNGKFAGRIILADTIKEDAYKAIKDIKEQRIHTVMLTGDSQEAAQVVAEKVEINEVHGKLLPEEKIKKLKKVRESFGTVMFVGDGINDAPVLAGADVSAAMGSGADAAIEAADIVFMNSSVSAITESIYIAKRTGAIAKQNIIGALLVKVLILLLGVLGYANMWMAVFADTGVAMLCVLNAMRLLYVEKK